MRFYLDASVALHALLPGGDPRARSWLDVAREEGEVFSSTLLHLELVRTLRREKLEVDRSRLVLRRINQVSIDDGVLNVAANVEPHVKSLDAIHLATCLLLGTGVSFVTHDATMLDVARKLGIDTLDPVD